MALLLSVLLAAVTAQPSEALGTVVVRSQPGAEVVWEGVPLGETDAQGRLVIEQVPPGSYRILVRKDGFREAGLSVTVPPGERTEAGLMLEEIPPPPKPAPRRAEPAPPAPVPTIEERVAEPEIEAPPPAREPPARPERRPSDPVAVGAAASAEPGPQAASEAWRIQSLTALLVLLLGGAAAASLWALRRARAAAVQPTASETSGAPFPEIRTVSAGEGEPVFIDELKRREQDLHEAAPGPRRPKVIEIEVARIRDVEGSAE